MPKTATPRKETFNERIDRVHRRGSKNMEESAEYMFTKAYKAVEPAGGSSLAEGTALVSGLLGAPFHRGLSVAYQAIPDSKKPPQSDIKKKYANGGMVHKGCKVPRNGKHR